MRYVICVIIITVPGPKRRKPRDSGTQIFQYKSVVKSHTKTQMSYV